MLHSEHEVYGRTHRPFPGCAAVTGDGLALSLQDHPALALCVRCFRNPQNTVALSFPSWVIKRILPFAIITDSIFREESNYGTAIDERKMSIR